MSWQENIVDDEMPPQWMWAFSDELETWFENVREERESKYSSDSSPGTWEENAWVPGMGGNWSTE